MNKIIRVSSDARLVTVPQLMLDIIDTTLCDEVCHWQEDRLVFSEFPPQMKCIPGYPLMKNNAVTFKKM